MVSILNPKPAVFASLPGVRFSAVFLSPSRWDEGSSGDRIWSGGAQLNVIQKITGVRRGFNSMHTGGTGLLFFQAYQ